jgi:Rrf2 family transcriptional regulator, cysteine metabolism repressor
MKISTKGEYGIRALLELGRHYGEGYIQSAEIAAARDVPENYLYQLLITLRKAGIIRSRRGPQGGHMLAKAPSAISIAEAIIALEGPLAPLPCVQAEIEHDCPHHEACAMRDVWQRVTESTEEILRSTTLESVLEREMAREAASR